MRPLENLSRRQREATPEPFARHLVDRVKRHFDTDRVAVLWVQEDSVYNRIEGCDCWPRSRDAWKYDGPHPVICHPPCGPWGKYKARCGQSRECGVMAMEFVERYGGVVEQPLGSELFRLHGRWWGQTLELVNQADFCHMALKPTLLYWVARREVGGDDERRR